MASEKVTHQPLPIEHELAELADQIQGLLFLSEGDCTQAQLEQYSDDLTHALRYARALGYLACFTWKDESVGIEWQPIRGMAQ